MADDCCKTTEDGATYCALPDSTQVKITNNVAKGDEPESPWRAVRGGAMFIVGCVLSPCCTPLLVPLALALAAGTPVAVWASLNLGLIYGALTLVSIASFLLAWRWLKREKADARTQQIPAKGAPQGAMLAESKRR